MRYTFTGKNTTITEPMRDKFTQKIDRIDRLFPENTEAFVTVKVVKKDHTVEVTIPLLKRVLRAEVTKDDAYVAIDEIVDILERQMVKYKGQLNHKSKKDIRFREEYKQYAGQNADDQDDTITIEKSKRFALKPMDAEEAVMEMELLNHGFYVFRNGHTDEVNVVYKRKNGTFGIIEPEC